MCTGKGQFGIYRIRNIINGHRYFGHSGWLHKRERQHFNELKRHEHDNQILQRAWNKHGEDAFVFEVIILCDSLKEALEYENFCLKNLNPEYNICKDASSSTGVKRSDDFREKVRISSTGNKNAVGKRTPEQTIRIGDAVRLYYKSNNGINRRIAETHRPGYGAYLRPSGKFNTRLVVSEKFKTFGIFDTQKEAHELAIKIKYINWPAHINRDDPIAVTA